MNHVFKVVWNQTVQSWQAVSEIGSRGGRGVSSGRRARRSGSTTVVAVALLVGGPAWAELPTGGVVTDGSGSISVSGSTMTIQQDTQRMVADWQTFNIGAGHTVEFVQPSSSAAALNRVLGSDVSTIQGALRANGQVFLLNPNGVLFTPSAQVNVGSLVTSTLNITNQNFMSGNLHFEGASSGAIVNRGSLRAAAGGSVALIAARIVNESGASITADSGSVLMGAGSAVTLSLGGPVRIRVEQAALDALIEQGGAVRADGGLVYLTAQSAGALTSTVINHAGVTRAQTVVTGDKGQIYLMGGMQKDRIQVAGTLDASAPGGGDGGFIETSAADVRIADGVHVTTSAPAGNRGEWLIDPFQFVVSDRDFFGTPFGNVSASTLGTALSMTDVTIDNTGAGLPASGCTNVVCDSDPLGTPSATRFPDIVVASDIIRSGPGATTTLTLKSAGSIIIRDKVVVLGGAAVPDRDGISTATDTTSNGRVNIEGVSGGAINLVLLSRAPVGGTSGAAGNILLTGAHIRTFGGHVIMGGGDLVPDPMSMANLANATTTLYAKGEAVSSGVSSSGLFGTTGVFLESSYIDASENGGAVLTGFERGTNTGSPDTGARSFSSGGTGGGGNVLIRGEGGTSTLSPALGMWFRDGASIATSGSGRIILDGKGGSGATASPSASQTCCQIASVGVTLEENSTLISATGDIVIAGRAGAGSHAYGVSFSEGDQLLRTAGGRVLINAAFTDGAMNTYSDGTPTNFNDNAVYFRDGKVTFDIGASAMTSEIRAPLVGGYRQEFFLNARGLPRAGVPIGAGSYQLEKLGTGTLTLYGDAAVWNLTRPGLSANTTFATKREGTYLASLADLDMNGGTPDTSTILFNTGLTEQLALAAFTAGPDLANPVAPPPATSFKFSSLPVNQFVIRLTAKVVPPLRKTLETNPVKSFFNSLFKPKPSYAVAKPPLFKKWNGDLVLKALKEGKMPAGANPELVKAALKKLAESGDLNAIQRLQKDPALEKALAEATGRSNLRSLADDSYRAMMVNSARAFEDLKAGRMPAGPLSPNVAARLMKLTVQSGNPEALRALADKGIIKLEPKVLERMIRRAEINAGMDTSVQAAWTARAGQ